MGAWGRGGLGTSKCLGVIKAVQPSWKWAVLSCVCAHGCAVVVCVCVQVRIQLSAVCRCVQAPCAVRVPTAGTPAWVSLGAEGAMGVPMLIKVPEPSMLGGHKRRLGAPPAQPPVPSLAPSLSSLMKPLSSLVAALIAEFVSSPVWGPRKGLTAAVPCATPTGYGQRAGAAYPGKGALVWDCTVGWEGLRALLHTPPCAFWCPLPTPGVRFGAAEPLAFNASMCLGTPCLYVSPPAIEVPGGGGYKITPSNLTFFPRRWEFWWPQPPAHPTPPPPSAAVAMGATPLTSRGPRPCWVGHTSSIPIPSWCHQRL